MADQAITALPKKTFSGSSKIAATDYLLGIDSAEGYQMLIQDLGEYIINKVTTSLAGSNQTLVSAISALNSNFACVNLGGVGSEAKTVDSTDWVDIITVSNINLPAGKYMFIAAVNATWSVSGYQFFPGIRVDSNIASSLYNYANPQTNQPVMVMGYMNVSAGTHTISLTGRVTNASKVVTIPAYQNAGVVFIHCA